MILEALYNYGREVRVPNRKDVFWVTELAFCLRKAYFDRVSPRPFPFTSVVAMEMGAAIHRVVYEALKGNKVFIDKEVPVSVVMDNVLLKGRVDAIVKVDGSLAVLEVKSVASPEPKQWMIRQARYYAALVGAPKAYILMIDRVTGAAIRLYEVKFDREETLKEIRARLAALKKALEEGKPPKPERSDFCTWCQYRDECMDSQG